MKLRVQALRGARERRAWSLAIGRRGVITLLGVTAGNASRNASNARGVTAGKVRRNSSWLNDGVRKCKGRSGRIAHLTFIRTKKILNTNESVRN